MSEQPITPEYTVPNRAWLRAGLGAAALASFISLGAPNPQSAQAEGSRFIGVSTAVELQAALDEAKPGQIIDMEDGVYNGHFTIKHGGTVKAPITLRGSREAILQGEAIDRGKSLLLENADYWRLEGFSLGHAISGLVLSETDYTLVMGLKITRTGNEALAAKNFSSNNRIMYNFIRQAGLVNPKNGEGYYNGTAKNNLVKITGGKLDKSDNNMVIGNDIAETAAEPIDIKEGSSGVTIRRNRLDGGGISSLKDANSLVDVKGNNNLIEGNIGTNAPRDGFQTFPPLDGWASWNVFRYNTVDANGNGLGFNLSQGIGNKACENEVLGKPAGTESESCTKSVTPDTNLTNNRLGLSG